jgi:hypothetical protein
MLQEHIPDGGTKIQALISVRDARRLAGLTVPEVREIAAELLGHPVPTLWDCTDHELRRVRRALPDLPCQHPYVERVRR